MPLGVQVSSREAPPARGAATDISVWQAVGLTTSGPTDKATKLTSLADFKAVYAPSGRATGNQLAYDAVDMYFRGGGSSMYFVKSTDATTYVDALALLPDVPGQVSILDPDPVAAHWALLETHAQSFNKRALYDVPDGQTVAELVTLGATLPQSRYGAAFGPWATIPGLGGVSTRDIPASPVIAGLIARADRTGNPNTAAAGRDWTLDYVQSLKASYSMDDINTLNGAGINSMALVFGVLENYGFDTPAYHATVPDTTLGQFNCSRTEMYLIANAKSIGEKYMFKTIDGQGHLASDLASDLGALCLDLYREGALFGATPGEAFGVDVTSVNDPDDVSKGVLTAVLSTKLSPSAREVDIELVSVPVNSTI
jgi:hypothetical protein